MTLEASKLLTVTSIHSAGVIQNGVLVNLLKNYTFKSLTMCIDQLGTTNGTIPTTPYDTNFVGMIVSLMDSNKKVLYTKTLTAMAVQAM